MTDAGAASQLQQARRLHQDGKLPEAERLYRLLLKENPDHWDALHLLGVLRCQQGRHGEGCRLFRSALELNPGAAVAWFHLGLAYGDLKRPEHALASYGRAIALKPDYLDAWLGRGNALFALCRFEEALADFDRAIALKPDNAVLHFNRGNSLFAINRLHEALAAFERAIALKADYADAYCHRGNVLAQLRRLDAALASYDRAIELNPQCAEAYYNRGNVLLDVKRCDEAGTSYERAAAIRPDNIYTFSGLATAALYSCNWETASWVARVLEAQIEAGSSRIAPVIVLGCGVSALRQLKAARNCIRQRVSPDLSPLPPRAPARHEKIRLAYLSADFRAHATAFLTAELFELHDRRRFEIVGISYGADDRSDTRERLMQAFDAFHDVRLKSDREAAQLIQDLEIDIAVDLAGLTQGSRTAILAYRPAPVAVNYLGYPGTMGADFIDYIIADAIVLPFDQQPFYAEKIVHLSGCYQVNDRKRAIAPATPSRRSEGLPENGLVFCCFNNNWKITPAMFDIWMRCLRRFEGSVLWLLKDNEDARRNLCAEAQARGVPASRLVFADRVKPELHLARHRLADLFLDTLPHNAHTTASDALRTALPVVTLMGSTFAGRVAASVLNAAGLPELITRSREKYEELIAALAGDPERLKAIRSRLAAGLGCCPLFDTDGFRRQIEAAFVEMWRIRQSGGEPRSFSVPVAAE